VSVRKVYCGRTAESIQMPFPIMSGVGRARDGCIRWAWLSSKGKGQF